ncbi:MAG: Ribosomal protein [Planctomycetota bacterium]|jgi:large subunit ribosomal protein L28
MARRCPITKSGTTVGRQIARRGLAKKDGGVGLKTTGNTKRKFKVNMQSKRLWVPEIGRFVRVKLSTRAMKEVDVRGAYVVLSENGLLPKSGTKKRAS